MRSPWLAEASHRMYVAHPRKLRHRGIGAVADPADSPEKDSFVHMGRVPLSP